MTWKDDLKTAWESGKIVYEADLDKLIDNINSIDTSSSPGITQTVNATDGSITLSNNLLGSNTDVVVTKSGYSYSTYITIGDSTSNFLYNLTIASLIGTRITGTYSATTNLTTYTMPTSVATSAVLCKSAQTSGALVSQNDVITLIRFIELGSYLGLTTYSGGPYDIDVVATNASIVFPNGGLTSGIEIINSASTVFPDLNVRYHYLPDGGLLTLGGANGSTADTTGLTSYFQNSSGGGITLTANTPYTLVPNVIYNGTAVQLNSRNIMRCLIMDDTMTQITGLVDMQFYNNTITIISPTTITWTQNSVISIPIFSVPTIL